VAEERERERPRLARGVVVAALVAEGAAVHAREPRVPDDLVEEVAEVEHEAQPVGLGALLVLEDHPAVGGLRALAGVLEADERELGRPRVAGRRRGDRATDPDAVAALVGPAVQDLLVFPVRNDEAALEVLHSQGGIASTDQSDRCDASFCASSG
jgi:hypothetical protein